MSNGDQKRRTFLLVFNKYMLFGVLLVLLSVILDLRFPSRGFFTSLVINVVSSVGTSVVVASIFTYVLGTAEFVEKISSLLQSIVIGRNFLGEMEVEKKKEALRSLIKPSSEEKKLYSNIEEYLDTYINNTIDVTKKCVRTNYSVNARAYLDKLQRSVTVDSKISYRLYPTRSGYDEIKIGFLEEDVNSRCLKIVVSTPHGIREEYEEKDLNFNEVPHHVGKLRMAKVDLSKHDKSCSHLDISLDMIEAGQDHWIMLSFCTLVPTDGFRYIIRCEDGLKIRKYSPFIYGANIHIDNSDSGLTASCAEWINEGTGISILISLPHDMEAEVG